MQGRPPAARSPEQQWPSNLPLELTSFVGREREISEVKRLLGERRLVTLTGPGGCGKTRLALAAAFEVAESFGDGAWWVGLASLSDPALMPQAVASVLEVREHPNRPLPDTLAEALGGKEMLLILDNCEHLVEACAVLIDGLLRACPKLRVLATSREALEVAGETAWLVPPLSLPELEDLLPVEELARYEAVRLFVERAKAATSSFELTPKNAPAVAQVCRALDGIPLAIELAAARTRVLPVEQICKRLENPLELLTGGSRTAAPRQRTLRATLAWSYEILGEPERKLFGRFSVFAGGFSLEAAEAVGTGDGIKEDDILNLLSGLVDKSLVSVAEPGEEGAARYRMLEPVRQYAHEQLQESGTAEVVRRRHAEHYLALAEEAEPELMGVRQAEWLERLKEEHGNLRAALRWTLVEGEHSELGLRLASALERFWWVGGHLSEGRHWLDRGLAGTSTLSASVKAKALSEAGWMALYQNDLERAVALLEESMSLFKELRDEPGIATSLFNLGHAVLHQGDEERLETLCEEAEALRQQFVNRWATAELLIFLGMAALYEGDHERAVALLEEGVATFREMGDTQRVTLCVTHLWMAELEGGDRERAAALVEENLRLLQGLGIKPRIYNDLLGSAVVAALGGRPARAVRLWGAAEALRETIGLAIVLWDHVPTDYEGQLAAASSQLGAEAFAVAWSQGKAMTPEEAIAYALDEAPPARDAPQPTTAAPRRLAPNTGQPLPVALTGRELEVLELIAEGLSNGQIAARLFIEVSTVKSYVNRIFKKLGVESRTRAVAEARKLHLLSE